MLILVDMQRGHDVAGRPPRNNPDAEANASRLLAAWRMRGLPIVHIQDTSPKPDSAFAPGQPGHDFKPEVMPIEGERVIQKHGYSAFIGTDLESMLRDQGIRSLVVAGMTSNQCVESTVRMAGDLGFDVVVAGDACAAFDRKGSDGTWIPAETIHQVSMANLHGESAVVRTVNALLEDVSTH